LSARGYVGRILHVDLTNQSWDIESPAVTFRRTYLGGSAMGTYYMLKHTPVGADPLGPENTLCLMTGVITGAPFSGQSLVTATAESSVSGLIGDSQSGGFWPAELKAASFDGVVFHGKASAPCWVGSMTGKSNYGMQGVSGDRLQETWRTRSDLS